MSIVVKSPTPINPKHLENVTLFLGGSIEMGLADNWQEKISSAFSDEEITIFNPRRDDWDSSWIQHPDNEKFSEQVKWELLAQDVSDINCYYFDPNTKAPITLMELGLYAKKPSDYGKSVVVFCTENYWRYGNVAIVCQEYNIPCVSTWNDFVNEIKKCILKSKKYYFGNTEELDS